jgi:hypothetical protein
MLVSGCFRKLNRLRFDQPVEKGQKPAILFCENLRMLASDLRG